MIALLLTSAFSFLAGAVGGALLYRNNVARLQKSETEGKRLLAALKNPEGK
jgi:hypothetical protein